MSEKYIPDGPNSYDSMEGVEPITKALETDIGILEKIKVEVMQECPLEPIIKELGKNDEYAPKGAEEIIRRRYRNCVECATEIRRNFDEYKQDSGTEEEISFTGVHFLKDFSNQISKCSRSFGYVMKGGEETGPFSGFWGVIRNMRSIERVTQFKPHCVIPTPYSAIMPSFMVKAFFQEYCRHNQDVDEPIFLLPQHKVPKLSTESEALKYKGYIRDEIKYNLTDTDEDIEKFRDYLSRDEKYTKWIKDKYDEDTISTERALRTWNLRSPTRNTHKNIAKILESFLAEKEIKVCILDEFANEGRTIKGMETLVTTIFDILKEIGKIPSDVGLKFHTLDLGRDAYYYAGLSNGWLKYPGKERESALGTRLKSGSLPKHKFFVKQFKVLGKHLAREYEILQELKRVEESL